MFSTVYRVTHKIFMHVRTLQCSSTDIIEAVELIKPHMLINTFQEHEYRLDICRETTGAHIAVYGSA
jgi:hypothetical protein